MDGGVGWLSGWWGGRLSGLGEWMVGWEWLRGWWRGMVEWDG